MYENAAAAASAKAMPASPTSTKIAAPGNG